jgi:hypothetical protein
MSRRELPAGKRQDVTVYGAGEQPFSASVAAPEQPGRFAFPPMAACITAAARLMLAILETLVTEQGGTWAFADTDSMAVVATEHGGLVPCPGGPERDEHGRECVRALSFEQVDDIVRRFEALNPYDRGLVPGSVLEIEAENYGPDGERRQLHCYSISAKRYALYNLDPHGEPILRKTTDEPNTENGESADGDEITETLGGLRKHSEHGLGHLLNPIDPEHDSRDWIGQLWQQIIETDAHGQNEQAQSVGKQRKRAAGVQRQDPAERDWLDRPALTRIAITSPRLLGPFDEHSRKRPAAERIRPYNFQLVAHVHEPGFQGSSERFLLVAPYESDPRKWRRLPWTNAYEPGSRYEIVPDNGEGEQLANATDGRVIVKTYRSVLADYRTHPEAKSLGPDGKPCNRATVGLLSRRPVKVAAIHHIGKESNRIEDAQSGLVTDLDEVLTEYRAPERDPLWRLTIRALRTLPVEQTAANARVSERTVKRARAGRTISKTARAKLTDHAARHARSQLRAAGRWPPNAREALLVTYLDRHSAPEASSPKLCACGCGQPIRRGRRGPASKWHSDACRKRGARQHAGHG